MIPCGYVIHPQFMWDLEVGKNGSWKYDFHEMWYSVVLICV